MRIYLISLFDPTPLDEPIYPRFIEIARACNNRGHEVIHFTTTFRHTTKTQRFDSIKEHVENESYKVVFLKGLVNYVKAFSNNGSELGVVVCV